MWCNICLLEPRGHTHLLPWPPLRIKLARKRPPPGRRIRRRKTSAGRTHRRRLKARRTQRRRPLTRWTPSTRTGFGNRPNTQVQNVCAKSGESRSWSLLLYVSDSEACSWKETHTGTMTRLIIFPMTSETWRMFIVSDEWAEAVDEWQQEGQKDEEAGEKEQANSQGSMRPAVSEWRPSLRRSAEGHALTCQEVGLGFADSLEMTGVWLNTNHYHWRWIQMTRLERAEFELQNLGLDFNIANRFPHIQLTNLYCFCKDKTVLIRYIADHLRITFFVCFEQKTSCFHEPLEIIKNLTNSQDVEDWGF